MHEPDFVGAYYADKDLSLLKKLTLVIPTYNRNYYLSRCLWYHAHFPFGEIIIADSSPEEKKVVNRETVAKVQEIFGANVRYLEYEPETEKYGGDIYRKWGDAVQHVETEYSQICTDKEFLIPTILIKYIQYLDKDKDYIACFGLRYGLRNDKSNKFKLVAYTADIKIDNLTNRAEFLYETFKSPQLGAKSLLLAISNTEYLHTLYNEYINASISDIRYGETFLGYTGYLMGKIHYFSSDPYKVRDEILLQKDIMKTGKFWGGSTESSNSRYPIFEEYGKIEDAKYFKEVYIHSITLQIRKYTNIKVEDAELLVKEMMNTPFFGGKTGAKTIKNVISKCVINSPFIIKIWDLMPMMFKKTINKLTMLGLNIALPLSTSKIISTEKYPETKIIAKIASETSNYHSMDLPIDIIDYY